MMVEDVIVFSEDLPSYTCDVEGLSSVFDVSPNRRAGRKSTDSFIAAGMSGRGG